MLPANSPKSPIQPYSRQSTKSEQLPQVLELQQQLPALLESFLGREPLLPGSLYTLRRRCGKSGCRCARGQLHASTVLSYRGQDRPRNISLPPEQLREVRPLTEDYLRKLASDTGPDELEAYAFG